jgi:hypothetical protein
MVDPGRSPQILMCRRRVKQLWLSAGTGSEPRSRTFRDSKYGTALRHLPVGYKEVNTPRMAQRCWPRTWPTGCMNSPEPLAAGNGDGARYPWRQGRDRHPAPPAHQHPRPASHRAGQLTLRLPPGRELLAEILAKLRDPDHPVHAVRPRSLGNHEPGATTGP